MTDRELLERAARVAGIEHHGFHERQEDHHDDFHEPMWGLWLAPGWWNPIMSDGDAFRLLHAIQADLHYGEDELGETIVTIQPFNVPFSECPWCEAYDIEGLRRAIVRAAAAMADCGESTS